MNVLLILKDPFTNQSMAPVPTSTPFDAIFSISPDAGHEEVLKQKRHLRLSFDAMIQRNLSSDTLRPILDHRHILSSSSSSSSLSTPSRSTNSNGPDSPYSRLSRNLSQLLDEEEAETDAKLLSRLGLGEGVSGVGVFEPTFAIADAVGKTGLLSSPRHVTVSITEQGGWSEQEFEELMAVLSACGHFVVSFVSISSAQVMLEMASSEEAQQVQSLVEGLVLQCSGRLCRTVKTSRANKTASNTGSPTELTSESVFASQPDSPRLISYSASNITDSHSFNHPIPTLPDTVAPSDDLKEIRIELEHQANDYVDSIYLRFRQHLVALCLDAMGNIVVQKLLERGDFERRLEICKQLSPHLAALSCHKNGTWVVQKFISLASNSTQSRTLRNLLMSSLEPYLVALLKDQFGNYVVQGCLGLGQCARCLLECLLVNGVDLGKSRFGARAMKSLLEPSSSRHYDPLYYNQIIKMVSENITELIVNPHGALLLSYLLTVDGGLSADCVITAVLECNNQSIFLNRHAVTVLHEACHSAPTSLVSLCEALVSHDNPLRLVSDQGAALLICTCMTVGGQAVKRRLRSRFGAVAGRATVHSTLHAEHLAQISTSDT